MTDLDADRIREIERVCDDLNQRLDEMQDDMKIANQFFYVLAGIAAVSFALLVFG